MWRMISSVNSVVSAEPPRSAVFTPSRTVSKVASEMARETRLASSSWRKVRSAAPARIMAIGLATFLPSSEGAVPCGASAMTVSGFSSSSSEIKRLGPRYGAEHLHHEVRDAVAVTVEGGDDERLTISSQEQRVGGIYELGIVADVAAVLRGAVHLLLEHPLVDGRDGVLGAAEDLGPHLARLDKGELRYAAAYPARDLLGPEGDLVKPLALAPLLRPVGVVDGHTDHRDRGMHAARGVDTGNAPSRAHDNGPVYARSQDRIGRAHVARFLRRNGRRLDAQSSLFHLRSSLVHDLIVCGPSILQRQVVAHEIQVEPGHRRVEHP